MKITKLPPGRFLVQFEPRKQRTAGGLFIPDTARGVRREEVGRVVMRGDAVPRNGSLIDIPVKEGDVVWVHPQYGDQWQPEEGGVGEIRSYDFADYRGTVEKEER